MTSSTPPSWTSRPCLRAVPPRSITPRCRASRPSCANISVICDDALTAGELAKCIKKAGGDYLKSVEVFDVYKGANIPEGKKSISFSLALRAEDQTLTDSHADEAVADILNALEAEYGVKLR